MRAPSWTDAAVFLAACGGTLGLAAASGGFFAVSWNIGLLACVWIGLVALLLGDGGRPRAAGSAMLGTLLVLTGWTALSAVWSDSVPASLEEAQRTGLYAGVVAAVLAVGRRVSLPAVAGGVVLTVGVVSIWNLVTRAGATNQGTESEPIGYANGLALLAVVGVLLAVGLARERRRFALLVLAPAAPVLVLSRSNGAWLALAAGLATFALLESRLSRRWVAVVAGVLGLAAAALVAALVHGHPRGAYWHVAASEVAARPVLGSGAGTYAQWWLRLRPTGADTLDAHNLYLELLAELGPLGLVTAVVALAAPLAAALSRRRQPLAAAVAAVLVAYAIGAGIDFHWELAAVTTPVLLIGASAAVQFDSGRRLLGLRLRFATGFALVALGVLSALALAGNAPLEAARDELHAGDYAAAARDAMRARRWAPWSAGPWLALGEARLALGDRTKARTAFQHAVADAPSNWNAWFRLAGVSAGEPRRRALARAAQLNPLYGTPNE